MIKYIVVPMNNEPYFRPIPGQEITYHVQKQDDATKTFPIQIVVRLQVDWAPGNVIRIEGVQRTTEGSLGVIGFYRLHSTESRLGTLEIQDA